MDKKRDRGVRIDFLSSVYNIPNALYNPCCGDMEISRRLESMGRIVLSTDFSKGWDFLAKPMPNGFRDIICEPPRNSMDYVIHALNILPKGGSAIFFLPMCFLESRARYNRIFRYHPPKYVYQFTDRMGDETRGSYAWIVWIKGYKGKTTLEWLR